MADVVLHPVVATIVDDDIKVTSGAVHEPLQICHIGLIARVNDGIRDVGRVLRGAYRIILEEVEIDIREVRHPYRQ